jgi:hypothetical protein
MIGVECQPISSAGASRCPENVPDRHRHRAGLSKAHADVAARAACAGVEPGRARPRGCCHTRSRDEAGAPQAARAFASDSSESVVKPLHAVPAPRAGASLETLPRQRSQRASSSSRSPSSPKDWRSSGRGSFSPSASAPCSLARYPVPVFWILWSSATGSSRKPYRFRRRS